MLSDALLFLLAPGIGKGKGAEKTAEEGEMKDAKSARSKKPSQQVCQNLFPRLKQRRRNQI